MKARMVGVVTTIVAIMLFGWVPSAAGGGGCHAGATTADATDESNPTVEMIDACFTPTTLRVEEGAEVTFVNRDAGITHNVGANAWGHFDDMFQGDAVTATFEDAGVYPYACSYHPGMTGAIVVGDGIGSGKEDVTVQAFQEPKPVVVTKTVTADASPAGWIAAGAIGLALGAAGGLGLAWSRRSSRAA